MPHNFRPHYSNSQIYRNEQISHNPFRYVQQQNSQPSRSRSQIYTTAQRSRSSTQISSNYVNSGSGRLDMIDNGSFSDTFLRQVQEYEPVIPIEVTRYFMRQSGLDAQDDTVAKLISIATQKFISDIILDAREQYNLKQPRRKISSEEQKVTLTPELLQSALREHGIEYIRPPFYE